MARICLLCLVWLLLAAPGNAQFIMAQGLQTDSGKLYLRHSPLGLIDFMDGNITVGTEYKFNSTWSGTMDAGAILYSNYFDKTRQATGILLRPGVRIYPGKYKDYFVEIQLHYKKVMYRINDWIDRDVVQGVASYEELTTFRYKKRVMGMHIMGGLKQYLGHSRRFFIEIYLGVGLHFKKGNPYDQPADSRYGPPFRVLSQDNNTSNGATTDDTPSGRSIAPVLPGGIRLVYKLW